MSHDNENPLIIDVVGEVEPPESSERHASKKSGRSAGKKGFFRKEKATPNTTATQAATEAEVDAAKRAAVAASVPPVQGPASQSAAPVQQSAPSQADTEPAAPIQEPDASAQPQPEVQETAQPIQDAQPQAQPVVQPAQPQVQPAAQPAQSQVQQPVSTVPPQKPQAEAPQAYVVTPQPQQPQQSVQPAPAQPMAVEEPPAVADPQPQVQQPVQPVQPVQPQVQQPVQAAQPVQTTQPVQPSPVPVAVPPQVVQGNMAAAVAAPRHSRAVYVFVILAVLVMLFAAAAVGFLAFFPLGGQTALAPTVQADLESGEVRPIGSVSLDQASKVSIRATAEGWNEETSTPVIAYIKRVEETSASDAGGNGSKASSADERYFAFAPNKNASVSLPAGRYTFSFIAPMNSDGSMYSVPDMVSMVVGDGGMAVLPVDLTLIPKDDLTQEQITRALAQLKTASEKGGESFEYEPFKKSIDLALNTWFPHGDTTTEQPATDLTQEQQDSLNAQADAQTATQNSGNSGNSGSISNASPAPHTHTWVAQYQQRWEPEIVPVIDMAAWESPVYARYRCQEGVLFETLDACLAHVRERGNEPYTTSNEIIRIDYHPAIVHYEEQGHYVNVITGYRCSGCGATGTLN